MYRGIAALLIILFLVLSGCRNKTKEELFSEGLGQIQNGNPGGAIVLLKNALEKDPNYLDARYQLGVAYTTFGKYEQAERELQKVLRQNPSYPGMKLALARLHSLSGKPDSAIQEAESYLKDNTASCEALEILGAAYAAKGRYTDAENSLLQALKLEPQRLTARFELVSVYMAAGKDENARTVLNGILAGDPGNRKASYVLAALEKTRGNADGALAIYRKIFQQHPSEFQALYLSGLILLEKGQADQAEKTVATLMEKFPKRPEGMRLKGMAFYRQKNFPEAIAALKSSIQIQPSQEASYYLGLSFYGKGDLENALGQFREILTGNSSFNRVRLLSAMILIQQRHVDDAIVEINRVLKNDDRNALAHNLLGSAYMAKGMYDEGLKELNRATELDPRIVDAHLKKGVFLFGRGKAREAESELQAAIQAAPNMLNTRLLLSSYYLQRNNPAKALAIAREGLGNTRSDAPLYNIMARIMFAERKTDEGLKYLARAKELDASFLTTYFNLAACHADAGNYDKALGEYATVLRMDPRNVRAMLNSAALLQVMGRNQEALGMYARAKETKEPAAYLALAGYHIKKNEHGKALSVLDEAIKSLPRTAAVLEMKGQVQLMGKDYRKAIATFDDLEAISPERGLPLKVRTYVLMKEFGKAEDLARRAITLQPGTSSGYMLLASVCESRNDLARAIDAAKKGAAADARDPRALVMLGDLMVRKKDYEAAMAAYREALGRSPDHAPAFYSQGALMEITGNRKGAVAKYRDALEKDGKHIPTLNNLAYLYADGYGSPKEALRLALTAYRQEPGNPAVLDTLGYALLKNGRAKDAVKILEKAISLVPGNPSISYHLALAEHAGGDSAKAIARMQNTLKMGVFPESDRARNLVLEWTGKKGRGI